MDFEIKNKYDFSDLVEIMKILRSPDGCPWDREQSHKSIRRDFLEECYEAIEAIDTDDKELLEEELGDVLFSAVNVARFADVDPEEALHAACEKFIRRYRAMESEAQNRGLTLSELPLEQQEELYQFVKREQGL